MSGNIRPLRGERFVAYADHRPAERLFIEITRAAADGSWADIKVCTWAVMWTKRQTLDERGMPPHSTPCRWTDADLVEQQTDHMAKLAETDR